MTSSAPVRVLALHDGYNGGNTAFYGPSGLGTTVLLALSRGCPHGRHASGRGEYLLNRSRRTAFQSRHYEYDQFSSAAIKQNILVIGSGFRLFRIRSRQNFFHTLDAQFNTTSGSGFRRAISPPIETSTPTARSPGSYYDSGVLLQASYLVTDRLEPFIDMITRTSTATPSRASFR